MKRLVCGAGMALVLGLMAGNTMAFQAYQLYHNKWAILCNDGSVHSYSGSAQGLSTVGPALCEKHGGVVGPTGGAGVQQGKPANASGLMAAPAGGSASALKIKKARPVHIQQARPVPAR